MHPLLKSNGYKPRKGKVLQCKNCGKDIYFSPSRASIFKNRSCSYECFWQSIRTNKPRKCVICGKEYYVSKSQVYYRNIKCCSNACRYKHQSIKMKKAFREHKKKQSADGLAPRHIYTRHLKKGRIKTQRSLIKKLDRLFSVSVRTRGMDKDGLNTCVTCGARKHWKEMDAGHYVPRNYMSLRFDERNVWPQCRKCNRFIKGNMVEYAVFMEATYGIGIIQQLNKEKRVMKQWKVSELEELIKLYQ